MSNEKAKNNKARLKLMVMKNGKRKDIAKYSRQIIAYNII